MADGTGLCAVGLKAQAVVAAGPSLCNLLSCPKYLKHFAWFSQTGALGPVRGLCGAAAMSPVRSCGVQGEGNAAEDGCWERLRREKWPQTL